MTTGINTGDGTCCSRCSHRTRPGDRYCERCGFALAVMPAAGQSTSEETVPVRPVPVEPLSGNGQPYSRNGQPHAGPGPLGATSAQDGTTRYLCAAAHLDEEFCDKAIAEFLVEPVRAIPPSPGVDSAAVLREAVAAQTRRRIRDALLLALLVIFACTNPIITISWTIVVVIAAALQAIGTSLTRSARRDGAQMPATDAGRTRRTVAALVVLVVVAWPAIGLLLSPKNSSDVNISSGTTTLGSLAIQEPAQQPTFYIIWLLFYEIILPILLISGLLLILVADEFTVAKLVTSSFRRGSFDPDASRTPSQWERRARSLGHNSFRDELRRVSYSDEKSQAAAGQADVVVYRGGTPFIGAGKQVAHHVMTLPLEPSEDDSDADPVPISVTDLHRHVAESLAALRSPSSLSPGQRLDRLQHREQVLLPVDRLLLNRSASTQTQVLPDLLPDLSRPPLAHLPLGTARALAENPLEWARYYSCFRVESWDRDLTTSCYLHIGTDQHMFYLEWTYCILFPVRKHYRSIDRLAESRWTTFGRSLVELIVLPASVPARLWSAFRRRKGLPQQSGVLVLDRYGAAQSIRELAADTEAHTYFQDADTERYVNIIDRALVRAVGQFLEERGYSVVEFTRMADPVINNFNVHGDVNNSVLGGGNRNVRMNMSPTGGSKGAK